MASAAAPATVGHTLAIGAFHKPVNTADPSPDGKWLCVLLDSLHVVLLPEALDYHPSTGLALKWDNRIGECASAAACVMAACLAAGF